MDRRLTPAQQAMVARAWTLRSAGHSLFSVAQELGVTKSWLREYAGMAS